MLLNIKINPVLSQLTDKYMGNVCQKFRPLHHPIAQNKKGNKGDVKHSNLGNSSVVLAKTAYANFKMYFFHKRLWYTFGGPSCSKYRDIFFLYLYFSPNIFNFSRYHVIMISSQHDISG